jgi:hypothetical protein
LIFTNNPVMAMKYSSKKFYLITASAALVLSAVQSQAQDYSDNFTTSGDFSANYSNGSGLTQSTSGGPGGAGYLSGATADGNEIYNGSTWDFSESGDTIQLSLLAQLSSATSGGGQYQMGIGAPGFVMAGAGSSTPAFASFRLSSSSSGPENYKAQYQYDNGSGTVSGTQSSAITLNLDDWYLFDVTLDNLGTGSYTITANLYDYGANGTAPVTGIDLLSTIAGFSESVTVSSSPLVSDDDLSAGFRVNKPSTSGFGEFTDFDVLDPAPVPEPQSWVLFGLSAVLGIYYRRRNK